MNEIKYYREMTNYPNIYDVYWGDFMYDSSSDRDIDKNMNEIFENRNRFIPDYNISSKQTRLIRFKEIISDIRSQNRDYFDHSECYKTNDKKYILIVSLYKPFNDIKDKMQEFGFTEIYKLYNSCATTWIKIFNTINDVNKFRKDNLLITCCVIEFDEITQTWNNNKITMNENEIKELKNKIKSENLKIKLIVYRMYSK